MDEPIGYTACWALTPEGRCRLPLGHDREECIGIPFEEDEDYKEHIRNYKLKCERYNASRSKVP